jgi:hypothetical protein
MANVSALPATLFTLPAGAIADMVDVRANSNNYGRSVHWEWTKISIPASLTPIDELTLFFSQFQVHPFGYPLQISIHAPRVYSN